MGVETALLGGALLGGGLLSAYTGNKQAKATEKAMNMQQQQAQALAQQQQEQYNKIDQKKPSVSAIKAQNVISDTPQSQLTDITQTPLLSLLMSQGATLGGGMLSNGLSSILNRNRGMGQ
jgi:hypothetical protein